jgi:transcriptional regulator with XRE-family HTH domain
VIQRRVVAKVSSGGTGEPYGTQFRHEIAATLPCVDGLPGVTESFGDGRASAVEVKRSADIHRLVVKHALPDSVNGTRPMSEYNPLPQDENDGDLVNLAELVRALRERRGLSQEELGRRIGISKAAISSIEIGRTKSLRGSTLTGLARELGVNPDELTGKKFHRRDELPYIQPRGSNVTTIRRIAVLGTASTDTTGTWLSLGAERAGGFILHESTDPDVYSVRITGDAYHPRIKSGEFVICEPGHEVGPGDEVLVKLATGGSFVREFAFERDGVVAFNGINNGTSRRTIPTADIEYMHYVSAICKPSRYRET